MIDKTLKHFLPYIFILISCAQKPEKTEIPPITGNPLMPVMDEKEKEKNLSAIQKSKKSIEQNLTTLKKKALDSIIFSEENIENIVDPIDTSESVVELYDQTITDIANDHLKTKYDRSQLGLLQDEELIPPQENPYEFLSPEGEFLDKNKVVYEKLRNANPYHEQGLLARECGLKKVILADQEFSTENKESAQTNHAFAQAMLIITLGELPLDEKRNLYEICTGKDLITGVIIAINE